MAIARGVVVDLMVVAAVAPLAVVLCCGTCHSSGGCVFVVDMMQLLRRYCYRGSGSCFFFQLL